MKASSKTAEDRDTASLNDTKPQRKIKYESIPSSLVEVDLAAHSDVGAVRPKNEDQYLAVRAERKLDNVLSSLPTDALPHSYSETAYGMCVADGIGGMPAGGLASILALRKMIDLIVTTPDWIMRMNPRKAAIVKRRLIDRFHQIDTALRERGERDPRLSGMGTTLTVAMSFSDDLFVANLGDSRAYLLRGSELRQLTRDHTLAQAMIDAGVATESDETVNKMRRVLTAAVGSTAPPTDPDVQRLKLQHGDQLLLATDGLTDYVDAETIASILRDAASADEVCRALIDKALASGSKDNITVLVARYRFPQSNVA
jgi:serine/threonine protein phosphatase PrpC